MQSVPSAANSRLSPLPHEPADFYDRSAPVDIPLDSAAVSSTIRSYWIYFSVFENVNWSTVLWILFNNESCVLMVIFEGFEEERERFAS